MFYSPFDVCDVCKQYVLLDQTQADCSREHHCHAAHCPLQRFFAEPDAALMHACEKDAKEPLKPKNAFGHREHRVHREKARA